MKNIREKHLKMWQVNLGAFLKPPTEHKMLPHNVDLDMPIINLTFCQPLGAQSKTTS